ncbi:MAG: SoxR reducing system RseC family protein [Tannerella sp.]|jgi:sigma-E factor negative regulatory protein RseC|nr:SoxR reducing system RseC family protein [Tannerella sp.]
MNKSIQHIGVIEKIEHAVVHVRIVQQSACSGCHAESLCPASHSSEKIIEVEDRSGAFSLHEEVRICAKPSQGMIAVSLAFVLPLILIILTLVAVHAISGGNEIVAGIAGLSILVPYYGTIRLMHGKLKKRFVFTLSKIS